MPTINPRTLIGRWGAGTLPATWAEAHRYLREVLRRLETVLRVLHGAAEHPAPTVHGITAASGVTNFTTTSDVAITGASVTITPDVDMVVTVTAHSLIQCTLWASLAHQAIITFYVNGVAQTGTIIATATAVNEVVPTSQSWTVTMSAGTAYTLALQGRTTNTATTFLVGTSTRMLVLKFPNLYKVT